MRLIDLDKLLAAARSKYGEWELTDFPGYLRCSKCQDVYIYNEWLEGGKWNYCPNCGAKMENSVK